MKRLLVMVMALMIALMAVPVMGQDSTTPAPAPATSDKATDTMQALKEKLKADKKLIVSAALTLTEPEAAAFWPVYESYQKDLSALNTRTMKLIQDYADHYGAMTDTSAKGMVDSYLKLEKDRIALMQSYTAKFRKAIPEVKVARYYQVENKIRAVVNYELADAIPLAE
jgi:hypothetical protein